MPNTCWFIIGIALIVYTLCDGFSFILMTRKTTNRSAFSMWIERIYWRIIRSLLRRIKSPKIRDRIFTAYAPMVVLTLLVTWAMSLIYGFALLSWSFGEQLNGTSSEPTFAEYFYLSGVTFSTLGYGDLSPAETFGQIFSLIEVGSGYSFIAMIIGYIPTITSLYTERELGLLRIEMQTGPCFTAPGALYRYIPGRDMLKINGFLSECNDWLLKLYLSHVCYPVLCYQRYNLDSVNWLKGVTVLVDLSAISLAWMELEDDRDISNLYARGTKTIQQFNNLFWLKPKTENPDLRYSREKCLELWETLSRMGYPMKPLEDPAARLEQYLLPYEADLQALSDYLVMPMADIIVDKEQVSAFE